MKYIWLCLTLFVSNLSFANGYTNTANVVDLEIIRAQGFQLRGEFGNPSNCTVTNTVFISVQHPQYERLLSVALAAYMSGKKLQIYSHQCTEYGWHGGTHNELTSAGSMYLKNE
ncbi:hypothetical protein [Teredinibacter sp. KSP-S5-2]|uniref:hypothetical protein n=1 Tax=Teredinibacter sp. KSP-S5-2 TaxID=3034506 RepID=UPI00293465D9|nr:hypothetical protein [Teredinibacter sp. KSP-S5-2]WNO07959.1 hypothetical protein P5V12_13325 [Teredinibacter sp. KSP-S5-2]